MSARHPFAPFSAGFGPVRLLNFPGTPTMPAPDRTAAALARLVTLPEYPGEAVARTVAEILTVATLDELKAFAREHSIDRDRLTLAYFNARAEELTETAALWLLSSLGAPRPDPQPPTEPGPVSADGVAPLEPFEEAISLRIQLYLSAGADDRARVRYLELVAAEDLDEVWLDRAAAERLAVEVRRQDLEVDRLEGLLAAIAVMAEQLLADRSHASSLRSALDAIHRLATESEAPR